MSLATAAVGQARVELVQAQREAFELLAKGVVHAVLGEASGAAALARAALRRNGAGARRYRLASGGRAALAQEQARDGLRQLRRAARRRRRAARPACRAASSASARATAPRAPRRRPRRLASSLRARAISAARQSSAWRVQRLDQRHRAALVEPVHEALHAGLDDRLGLLRPRPGASRRRSAPAPTGRRRCRGRRRDRRATSGSMSRGTARSTMNIGRCRRAFSARSTAPRPMIGSELAVHEMTMSNSASRAGRSARRIASAPKRPASFSPRSSVRLATAIALRRCARRSAWRPARSSRRRRRTAPWSRAGPRTAATPAAPRPPPC